MEQDEQGGFLDVLSGNQALEVKHVITIAPIVLLIVAVVGVFTVFKYASKIK